MFGLIISSECRTDKDAPVLLWTITTPELVCFCYYGLIRPEYIQDIS